MKIAASAIAASLSLAGAADGAGITLQHQIEMKRFVSLDSPTTSLGQTSRSLIYAPDGRQVLYMEQSSSIAANRNDFELYLAQVTREGPATKLLIRASGTENVDGISQVRWLSNSQIGLLAASKSGTSQVSVIDTETGVVQQLTDHDTNVLQFNVSSDLRSVIFAAEKVPERRNFRAMQDGVPIGPETVSELASDGLDGGSLSKFPELYVQHGKLEKRVPLDPKLFLGTTSEFSVSPDGAHAIVSLRELGELSAAEQKKPDTQRGDGQRYYYYLIDMTAASAHNLIDKPVNRLVMYPHNRVRWLDGGRRVAVSHVLMDGSKLPSSLTGSVVETEISTGKHRTVAAGEFCFLDAPASTSERSIVISAARERLDAVCESEKASQLRFNKGRWLSTPTRVPQRQIQAVLTQSLTISPKLIISDPQQRQIVVDPAPELNGLTWNVEVAKVRLRSGTEREVIIFKPESVKPDAGYPAVLQFGRANGAEFQNGYYGYGSEGAGGIAPSLASEGFVVASVNKASGPGEADRSNNIELGDAVIDLLIARRLVDPNRLAVIGHSHYGWYASNSVVFGRHRFAAIVRLDASNDGYAAYAHFASTRYEPLNDEQRNIFGGPPLGADLKNWIQKSSNFNLDTFRAPLLEYGFGSAVTIENTIELVHGLRGLGQPVDYIWLPNAVHVPVQPQQKYAIASTIINWFKFWTGSPLDKDFASGTTALRWKAMMSRDSAEHQ